MEETISLKEIFDVLKKRFLMIIALMVGAAALSAILTYGFITPTYESSSQFIVNQKQADPNAQITSGDIRTNVELINTYNHIIKSPRILDIVLEELDLPYSNGVLSGKLQVSSPDSSQVVNVTVTDPDPQLATDIANTTVQIFQEEISSLMNVDNVQVLSPAVTSANPSPVNPKPALNIAIALVLGAMVGVGIAFLLEYMDTTIKTEDDITKKFGVPVLGVISHMDDSDMRSMKPEMNKRRQRGA
ncbi:YveK family protein [Ornithinibacillus halophilus]|uniref:Capsular polysaccharide biosynthesis protein n=1 Tax=Ornithinibacillus halophilus TaxID=930117 RepID=A0A1M5GGP5_9BACI|nr:Wzz/FepE/Etk N-terminal domain-containing protein [Ornithinibacillus halophilus]SHG02960.1 Capsular polysaccharide biosynthesis protein [Ornithinibacillus halophilus]